MSHDLSEVMTFVLPITPDLAEDMSSQRFRLGVPECRESGGDAKRGFAPNHWLGGRHSEQAEAFRSSQVCSSSLVVLAFSRKNGSGPTEAGPEPES